MNTDTIISQNCTWQNVNSVVVISLGHMNGFGIIWNLWYELYVWGSSASLQSCSISNYQASVMSSWCVRVICDVAPMSFHSSLHFKPLYTLMQCDEVWISFLPVALQSVSFMGEPHVLWLLIVWIKNLYWILIDWR